MANGRGRTTYSNGSGRRTALGQGTRRYSNGNGRRTTPRYA